MRYKSLYILFVLLNIFDLVASYIILDPSLEANPVMRWLWITYGFIGVTGLKTVTTFVSLGYLMYAEDKCPKLVLTGLIIGNSALFIVCSMLVYTWLVIERVIR
jgi:hypothetical protein